MNRENKLLGSKTRDWGPAAFSGAPVKTLQAFKGFKPFHSIIHYYVDLSCFLIPSPSAHEWWALNRRKRLVNISDLDDRHGNFWKRYQFVEKCFRETRRTQKSVCGTRLGFQDLFIPIVKNKKILGFLQAGTFAAREIDSAVLKKNWKELSGLEPAQTLPEYRDYVRAVLDMPVLDGPLLAAYQESLELFADLLAEEKDDDTVADRTQKLLVEVFSKQLPHSYWMDWALKRPTSEPVPFWGKHVGNRAWVQEEIGIHRVPTTVLTVMPLRPGGGVPDWTEEMLRIYRLQRRAFRFAQTLPETVAGKLENYGAVFVTSSDPTKPRLQRRKYLEAVADKIRVFAENELKGPVLVGIGETVVLGESLAESYRQAVLALHLGRNSEKKILFFSGAPKERGTSGFLELRKTQAELDDAFVSGAISDMESVQSRFLKQVLDLSFENPYETRRHFQYALLRLTDSMQKRMGLGKREAGSLRERLVLALEEAGTLSEMVAVFQDSVSELRGFTERPSSLGQSRNLERVKDYIEEHFREPLRAQRLAKMAGLSLSTFSRRFKKMTGLGLEPYLQNLRVKEAQSLLTSTRYTVARIAGECGFKSVSYFIFLFRKKTGLSPEKFRMRP
jgi:AraC-like DNA-binding protein